MCIRVYSGGTVTAPSLDVVTVFQTQSFIECAAFIVTLVNLVFFFICLIVSFVLFFFYFGQPEYKCVCFHDPATCLLLDMFNFLNVK